MTRPRLCLLLGALVVGFGSARAEEEGPELPGIIRAPSTDEPSPAEPRPIRSYAAPPTEPVRPTQPATRGLDREESSPQPGPISRPSMRRPPSGDSPQGVRGPTSNATPGQGDHLPNTAAPKWQPRGLQPDAAGQPRPMPQARPPYRSQQYPAPRGSDRVNSAPENPSAIRRGQGNPPTAPPANGYRPQANGYRSQSSMQDRWNQPARPGYTLAPGAQGQPSAPQSRTSPFFRQPPPQDSQRATPNTRPTTRPTQKWALPRSAARAPAWQAPGNPARPLSPPSDAPRAPWDAAGRER
jgi:hypothetical protein